MDPNPKSSSISTDKKQMEVVLVIPGEEAATTVMDSAEKETIRDPKLDPLEDPDPKPPRSPDILKSSQCPKKPPRPPQPEVLLRRRSIPSSAFSKPKSRFAEQPPPPASNSADPQSHERPWSPPYHGFPNPRASATPKTPSAAAEEEEEEEEEVYKREQFPRIRKLPRWCRFFFMIEWLILVCAMGCMVASLTVRRLHSFVIWGLEIWKWCLMVTVICCGRLVTHWLTILLVFLIERNFILRKKVLYFVYGLKRSVQICIWLGLIIISWSVLFNRGVQRSAKTEKVLNFVSRALASLLVGSVIWLAKTLLVKILASSFHMNRFFDRIQESIFYQYVLQTLSGPPAMELAKNVGRVKSTGRLSFSSTGRLSFSSTGKGKEKGKGKGKETGKGKGGEELGEIDVAKLHRMSQEKVSAGTMKGLINVIRSSGLTTISSSIDETSFDEGKYQRDREISSEWEAKVVANQIFKNVAKPGYKYIEEEDLLRFLIKEEVDTVLPLFEGAAETGKIKKSALKIWVVKAYLDRKSLSHSLNDTKTAVNQLHKLASCMVSVVILIVALLLMGIATTQVLVFISSQLLVVVFMFGNTCKTAFEAIVFVFIMHPFDVGDRCVVDGIQMTVEEMNILTTVFLRFDNEKIYYPNAVLSTKPISNFYRSPDMSDSIEFSVDVKTSVECIGTLKARIKMYIESKPNHWHPTHSIVVKDIVNVNSMNMVLCVRHTMNYQNVGETNSRRSDLVLELKKMFEELSIHYHLLPQQVQLAYTGSTPLPMTIM